MRHFQRSDTSSWMNLMRKAGLKGRKATELPYQAYYFLIMQKCKNELQERNVLSEGLIRFSVSKHLK